MDRGNSGKGKRSPPQEDQWWPMDCGNSGKGKRSPPQEDQGWPMDCGNSGKGKRGGKGKPCGKEEQSASKAPTRARMPRI